jgi:hypothetical protein
VYTVKPPTADDGEICELPAGIKPVKVVLAPIALPDE